MSSYNVLTDEVTGLEKKDLEAFGRVLRTLGDSIIKNPEKWFVKLGLVLDESVDKASKKSHKEINLEVIQSLQLYDIAKSMNKDELVTKLKQFNVDELKFFVKEYKLGSPKLKSVDSLAEYIADQVKKRTTDVFQHHEK